ncbi:MAG: hypothetical protein HXK98_03250 [Candidatus Nanogingivalaceae bacterium]|nr:hypothetical protein [Candidatus Nanogingivalaceae bacterium]
MKKKIFYSWQSDNSKTRRHIEKALQSVIKEISDTPELEDSPRVELDKDTKGAVGAVNIGATIKDKINNCDIFLADVSIIDRSKSGKGIVNQNVMFELGYAIGKHTEEKVIQVANTDLGNIEELPFDIAHQRTIGFSIEEDNKAVSLKRSLKEAIVAHLNSLANEEKINKTRSYKDNLINAIDKRQPAKKVVRDYFANTYKRYLDLSPGVFKEGVAEEEYAASVYDAYCATKDISIELHEVLEKAAEYERVEILEQAYKSIQIILDHYAEIYKNTSMPYEISIEYYSLIINEIISLIVGSIVGSKSWTTLPTIAKIKLINPGNIFRIANNIDLENITTINYPEHVLSYYKKIKDRNFTLPTTQLLQERFTDNPNLLQTYIDGNIMQYLMFGYFPWLLGLLLSLSWKRYIPGFIEKLKDNDFMCMICKVIDSDYSETKDRIWYNISRNYDDLFMSYNNQNLLHVFAHAGITTKEDLGKNNRTK